MKYALAAAETKGPPSSPIVPVKFMPKANRLPELAAQTVGTKLDGARGSARGHSARVVPAPNLLSRSAYAVVNHPERRAVRIGYEMQCAREEPVASTTLSDVDEADLGEWTREKRFDPRA